MEEKALNIRDYLAVGLRRKWCLIIPLAISIAAGFAVYRYLPKIYKATTVILVQPQRVPESYVRSTITAPVTDRLNTISQEILSRTRLEKTMQAFNLYEESRRNEPLEVVVEKMRKDIEIKVFGGGQQNTFSVSFAGDNPNKVMMVTNKLASWFIEENLRVREMQAEGTSEFLTKELQAIEEQLKKKEQAVRSYKERNMGQLPQQLDANLRISERLQQQLQTTAEGIKTIEDRNFLLQGQIEDIKKAEQSRRTAEPRRQAASIEEEIREEESPSKEDPLVSQLSQMKRDIGNARTKYTENHPDIIDLKKKIAALEPKVDEMLRKQGEERETRAREQKARRKKPIVGSDPNPVWDPEAARLLTQYQNQLRDGQMEAGRLREELTHVKSQISVYQRRVEDTPKREEELIVLLRDYDLLKTNYQSLLDKKIASQMAENLEKKQQGEQFRILDPARLPERPFKPDFNKIMLVSAFIGICFGVGLAWLRETWNQKFHSETEVESVLGIPVIAVIANLKEDSKTKAA